MLYCHYIIFFLKPYALYYCGVDFQHLVNLAFRYDLSRGVIVASYVIFCSGINYVHSF